MSNEGISRRDFFKKAGGTAALTGLAAAGLTISSEAEAEEVAKSETIEIEGFPAPDETPESAEKNIEAIQDATQLAIRLFKKETNIDTSSLTFEFNRRHESVGMYIEMYMVHNGTRYVAKPAYDVLDRTRINMLELAQYIKDQLDGSKAMLEQLTGADRK
ncbi:hypothetical protein BH11PAT2_BH11PAT2_06390 [soil metagenome]